MCTHSYTGAHTHTGTLIRSQISTHTLIHAHEHSYIQHTLSPHGAPYALIHAHARSLIHPLTLSRHTLSHTPPTALTLCPQDPDPPFSTVSNLCPSNIPYCPLTFPQRPLEWEVLWGKGPALAFCRSLQSSDHGTPSESGALALGAASPHGIPSTGLFALYLGFLPRVSCLLSVLLLTERHPNYTPSTSPQKGNYPGQMDTLHLEPHWPAPQLCPAFPVPSQGC
jgi:hypothetical protein